uniref:Integrase core domain containing protein n=1 Tax=Solanum tuberosum TaxID=4113 RepID=M1DSE0_SOLTU
MPPHECQKTKDSEVDRSRDMLSRILNKVEGSEKTLQDMKEDVSTLSQTVTSHFVSIKQLETQISNISSHLNLRQQGGFPSNTMSTPKNEVKVWKEFENVEIGEQKSSRQLAEEVGEPDLDRCWTQDNFKLESGKLDEPKS